MAIGIRNDKMMIQKNKLLTVPCLSCVSFQLSPGLHANGLEPRECSVPVHCLLHRGGDRGTPHLN